MSNWLKDRWTAERYGSSEVLSLFVLTHLFAAIMLVFSSILGWLMGWEIGGVKWNPLSVLLLTDDLLGSIWQSGRVLFIIAIICGFAMAMRTKYFYSRYDLTSLSIGAKFYISLMAGLWEEFGYRGAFIFTSMLATWWLSKITGGAYLWLVEHIWIPLSNLVTFGLMSEIWFNHPLILVAGMLKAANAFIRGHDYQGLVGTIFSMYFGFYVLYVSLSHGLVVAMAIHFLYDFLLLATEHVVYDAIT